MLPDNAKRMIMKTYPLLTVFMACLLSPPITAATIHVPADHSTIQAGIDAAVDGDTVLVAAGTYQENIDFLGKAISVVSEQGPEATTIEVNSGSVIRFKRGEGLDSLLRGFKLTGGTGTRHSEFLVEYGGGIFCSNGSAPAIEECVISGCTAYIGGGIAIETSQSSPSAVIQDCTVEDNTAVTGAGIYLHQNPTALRDCRIQRNEASSVAGGVYFNWSDGSMYDCCIEFNTVTRFDGAGIYCDTASPTISFCTIAGNETGAGGTTGAGGGFYVTTGANPEISGCTIEANKAGHGAGIACKYGSSPLINSNLISGNTAYGYGGGISCTDSNAVLITNNEITNNTVDSGNGGGIVCGTGNLTAIGNTISRNSARLDGGGINASGAGVLDLQDNRIVENHAGQGFDGGGMFVHHKDLRISGGMISGNSGSIGGAMYLSACSQVVLAGCVVAGNNAFSHGGGLYTIVNGPFAISGATFAGNSAGYDGGAIYTHDTVTVTDSIFWDSTAGDLGKEVYLYSGADFTISYTDLDGLSGSIHKEPGSIVVLGDGMIDADPLFVEGPDGAYYLSQTAAGQPENSPCVDAGDPAGAPPEGTTRTDQLPDQAPTDLGAHYAIPPVSFLITGPGPARLNPPLVRVFLPESGLPNIEGFKAYGAGQYGVNVCCGDMDGDNSDEILTGAGPGAVYGPHVRGFDLDGTPLTGLSFLAYGTNRYGVNVGAGDIDGDSFDEIITGAGPGAVFGPHVRAWDYDGTSGVTSVPGVSFFAYGTPKWGVNVSAGDIDGDGYDEIVTGAGPGAVYGPHVRGWNVDGSSAAAIPGVSFLAYGTNKFGVNVSCGDVDGDGIDEIVTGAGPGSVFGPHVRGWNYDGNAVAPLPGFSFFAWQTAPLKFGVNVFAKADLNGNGRDELVVGRGPDPDADTEVKVFTYDGVTVSEWLSLEAFSGLTHGANVAAGRRGGSDSVQKNGDPNGI